MLTDPKSLEMIQKTAVKADGQRIVKVDSEPSHIYFTVDQDGKMQRQSAELKPANDTCLTVDSLCEWLDKLAVTVPENPRQIWIGDKGICATLEREFAKYLYEHSAPFKMLQTWAAMANCTKELSQTELYQLLRTTFRGCLPDYPNLAQMIGKVDIRKAQEASGTVATGKVSVSKSMMAEASGATELPDLLVFNVPLFNTAPLSLKVRIETAFDLYPQTETFRVSILPGQIDAALHQGRVYLLSLVHGRLDELKSKDIEVYFGEPSKP